MQLFSHIELRGSAQTRDDERTLEDQVVAGVVVTHSRSEQAGNWDERARAPTTTMADWICRCEHPRFERHGFCSDGGANRFVTTARGLQRVFCERPHEDCLAFYGAGGATWT